MTTPWYDDGAEICKRIEDHGLAGLVEVIRQRHAACYERKETLEHQWILVHRFVSDTCGNLGRIDDVHADQLARHWEAPKAVRLDQAKEIYGALYSRTLGWSMWNRLSYPMPAEICDLCGADWNLDNAHDVSIECTPTRHRWCERLRVFTATLDFYDALLRRLEIVVPRNVVPNGYWPPGVHDAPPPWIALTTKHGTIRMGRRKNVWVVDWSMTTIAVAGSDVVGSPSTTHGTQSCHCWTEAELEAVMRGLKQWVDANGGWT